MGTVDVTVGAAFLAGILSFFSPCILPLIPVYITQLSSSGMKISGGEGMNRKISFQALIFILGFSLVFITLGMVSSFIGQFLNINRQLILKIMGVVVVLFGLNLMGIFRFSILMRQWSPLNSYNNQSTFRSFFLGVAFAFGWTPCIGPILAAIMTLAATSGSAKMGAKLLAFYSIGLAVPFMTMALTLDRVDWLANFLRKYSRYSMIFSGLLLVILGILLYFDKFQVLAGALTF